MPIPNPLREKHTAPYALINPAAPTADPLLREGGPIPRCQHLRLSGQQCGSPAMRGQKFCYFHDTVRNPYSAGHGVPMPECAASIQIGLGRVIRCLEAMPETPKTYALMLYALQTASANLKRVREDERIEAESEAAASEAAEKSKSESLFEILKRELELEPPPEGTVE